MTESSAPDTTRRGAHRPTLIVSALIAFSLVVRAWLSARYFGFQTGDDVEIAERAFQRAIGLSHQPWDIRSLFLPDLLVAPFVRVAASWGVLEPLTLLQVAKLPFLLAGSLNIALVYLLGRRWHGQTAGVVAAALYSCHWLPLVYGSSLYVRLISTSLILAGALLVDSGRRGWTTAGGVMAALALTARYSEALFGVALIGMIAFDRAPRRLQRALLFALGYMLTSVIVLGWYDYVTRGRPFFSLIRFAELTFIAAEATSQTAVQPPWWYVANIAHWLPLTLVPFVWAAFRSDITRRYSWLVAFPVLSLSAIFHKEFRYLQAIIPFLVVAAAGGFSAWWAVSARRRWAVFLLVAAFPWAGARIGQASKRSTNAVVAASRMREMNVRKVALSQSWAYGNRVLLNGVPEIVDVGIPPDIERVRREGRSYSVLAVYEQQADSLLRNAAHDAGLVRSSTIDGSGGRTVVLFTRE